jgi:hypothetical protein
MEITMPKKWTHTKAFEHFGTKPANLRWSWSARSPDDKMVANTFWQDEFKKRDGKIVYKGILKQDNHGGREQMRNLQCAMQNCQGRIYAIIAVARDSNAEPRSIKECFPSRLVMRLTRLDLQSGEFEAEAEPA